MNMKVKIWRSSGINLREELNKLINKYQLRFIIMLLIIALLGLQQNLRRWIYEKVRLTNT